MVCGSACLPGLLMHLSKLPCKKRSLDILESGQVLGTSLHFTPHFYLRASIQTLHIVYLNLCTITILFAITLALPSLLTSHSLLLPYSFLQHYPQEVKLWRLPFETQSSTL